MVVAIILAGGLGKRIGSAIPKQFIEVMGKPILAYTIENFQSNRHIDAIEIVYHETWFHEVEAIVQKYSFDKVKWMVPGGDTFQRSVMAGVYNLKEKLVSEDIVVVSFGVSPFTTNDIIDDSIRVCEEHGNAVAVETIPLCTCIIDDEHCSTQSIIRETLRGFSNPWTFRFGELYDSYREAIHRGILDELEPHTTSLYFALGKKIWFSASNGYNFKITTREDLEKFEGLLLLRKNKVRGTAVNEEYSHRYFEKERHGG